MFNRTLTDNAVEGTSHDVAQVIHRRDVNATDVAVIHTGENVYPHVSTHEFPLDFGMTFEDAERLVMELPEYAEVEDEQSLVERMRTMLTPEQLAELGIE